MSVEWVGRPDLVQVSRHFRRQLCVCQPGHCDDACEVCAGAAVCCPHEEVPK